MSVTGSSGSASRLRNTTCVVSSLWYASVRPIFFWRFNFHDGLAIVKPAPRHRKVVSVHCVYCSGGSLFEVRDNLIRLQVWCSFLSTHAFLLGNGQTYAALGVPYYRVSRILMSRNFHPCKLVPQIHVSHFPPLQYGASSNLTNPTTGAAFSCPASSCLAFSASPHKSQSVSNLACGTDTGIMFKNLIIVKICKKNCE